jgi:acetyl-CoA carboxylase carboxyltransferase component
MRKDLNELYKRKEFLKDENRSESVKKRHNKGSRTARENIMDLCDKNSFNELGSLITAAQTKRFSKEELIKKTPADGLVAGIGNINGKIFGEEISKCCVMSYDYMVLAGTQGGFNHKKTDRLISIAKKGNLPIIFFVEGGGGRPGDVDFDTINSGGLDLPTWSEYAKLSGKVPRISIVSGNCFAGNAAIAGCSDVIIATKNSSIGMAGPAMIKEGGLGDFKASEIGPSKIQYENGVIDILVENEKDAVEKAKQYLSYFQGNNPKWKVGDQNKLHNLIPEDRKYAYDVTKILDLIFDQNSVLELRGGFAKNMITSFARIDGKPVGIIANSTKHLGGAIDSDASEKASRFMQLCDAFNLPLVSFCDTPGFMVGPTHEKLALVRKTSRFFINGANLNVPIITIILRKAYGLGAMAMAGGNFHESYMTLSWQTGEFGPMGLEASVELGFKKELESVKTKKERDNLYNKLVKEAYERGKAINAASTMEIDEVIDPLHTRDRILTALNSYCYKEESRKKIIDSW